MSLMREPIFSPGASCRQAAHAHHVAALLVVGVGVEEVVGHVLEHGLDHLAAHLVSVA
jgi:hypothetical protein